MTTAIIDPATLAAQPAAQPAHHPATPPTVTPILQTLHIPALGALWPQQGGVFAGITTDSAGRTVAVIVPPKGVGELGLHKWGSYGREIESARHRTDGHANTQALLASQANGYAHPAAAAVAAFNQAGGHGGHTDWHLPSIGDLQLAHMHCPGEFEESTYWSSTQDSAHLAFAQSFAIGDSYWSYKYYEFRVRALRRIPLQHFNA